MPNCSYFCSLIPWQLLICFCLWICIVPIVDINDIICVLFVSTFFLLLKCFQDSAMSFHALVHPFFVAENILVCGQIPRLAYSNIYCFQQLTQCDCECHVQVFTQIQVLELQGHVVTTLPPSLLKHFPVTFKILFFSFPSNSFPSSDSLTGFFLSVTSKLWSTLRICSQFIPLLYQDFLPK